MDSWTFVGREVGLWERTEMGWLDIASTLNYDGVFCITLMLSKFVLTHVRHGREFGEDERDGGNL